MSNLRSLAYALGDASTDPLWIDGDNFDADVVSSGDPRTDYLAWAAAVKNYGGVVTTAPHLLSQGTADPSSGQMLGAGAALAAARYPVAFVFPHAPATDLNPLFKKQPDDWSDDGKYAYYVAPDKVQGYVDTNTGGQITAPQSVPGEPPPPDPTWYADLKTYAKLGGLALGAILFFDFLHTLPRPNGRRRRR